MHLKVHRSHKQEGHKGRGRACNQADRPAGHKLKQDIESFRPQWLTGRTHMERQDTQSVSYVGRTNCLGMKYSPCWQDSQMKEGH